MPLECKNVIIPLKLMILGPIGYVCAFANYDTIDEYE